jgi:hypothetical protein
MKILDEVGFYVAAKAKRVLADAANCRVRRTSFRGVPLLEFMQAGQSRPVHLSGIEK